MGIGTGTFILLSLVLFPPLLVHTIPKFVVAEDGGLAANLSRPHDATHEIFINGNNPPALSNSPQ
jgi:hypothetical protein